MAESTTAAPRRLAYQPALDGLRALAVTGVLLYHDALGWARGGFLGVDAFFVLSGYLITSLLVRERVGEGRIDFVAFWGRRARRLLPALFLMLLGVALYAIVLAGRDELRHIRGDGLATLFYVQNWHLVVSHQSYFDQFVLPSPLRHTWSLAIEEQWYLVWPLALSVLLWRARGRLGRVLPVVAALAVGSALLMAGLYTPGRDPSRVYYGTDTRAQALLLGAALALVLLWRGGPMRRLARVALELAGLGGALYLGWLVTHVSGTDPWLYRGGSLVVALAAALVIAAAVQPTSPVLRAALSVRPLRAIGLVSYGVYLYHWPVYLALTPARVGVGGSLLLAIRVAVTLAISTVSYNLVEMPVRRGVLRGRWPLIVAPAAVAAVCVALVAATTGAIGVVPSSASAAAATPTPRPNDPGFAFVLRGYQQASLTTPPGVTKVLVAGDSVAFTLGMEAGGIFNGAGIRGSTIGLLGCGVARGDTITNGQVNAPSPICASWPSYYRDVTDAFDPDVSVLMIGAWEVLDRVVDGRTLRVGTPALATYLRGELEEARKVLTARGAHLIMLTTPCFDTTDTDVLRVDTARRDPRRVAWLNGVWRQFVSAHPGTVTLGDLGGFLCPHGKPLRRLHGARVRNDGIHFTPAGARATWEWLAPIATRVERQYPRAGSRPAPVG